MSEECDHQFDMITYDQAGNMWPTTRCIKCDEGFIIEEKTYNQIYCLSLMRGPTRKYDYFTGLLVVEKK